MALPLPALRSLAVAAGAAALVFDELVEHDGDDDHRAGDESAPGRVDAEEDDAARITWMISMPIMAPNTVPYRRKAACRR